MSLRRLIPTLCAVFAVLLAIALTGCASNPELIAITVTPGTGTNFVSTAGATVQYQASGLYRKSNQTEYVSDITRQVQWTSSLQSVATIQTGGSTAGLATSVGNGFTTISASTGGMTGTSDLIVSIGGSHTIQSVTVNPPTQTLTAVGQQAQFEAIATYNTTPTSLIVTNSAIWTSSEPGVIPNPVNGLVTVASNAGCPVAGCVVTITATATDGSGNSAAGTATVTVLP